MINNKISYKHMLSILSVIIIIGLYKNKITSKLVRVERFMTREDLAEKIPMINCIGDLLYIYLSGIHALAK